MPILPIFTQYPAEGAIIGRLLAGYSDLEIGLMFCVMIARDDFNAALKTMYRVRGESQRILLADALARERFRSLGLGTQFEMVVGSMHHCRKIRNQFAHCAWYGDASGSVTFASLEEMAERHESFVGFDALPVRRVGLGLLQMHEAYFEYVDAVLVWLQHEAKVLLGKATSNPFERPKQLDQPPLHS